MVFLTRQAHLLERATWSLEERVAEFRTRYPGTKMNRWKLAAIYRMRGIQRLVLKKRHGNPNLYPPEVLNARAVECRARLQELQAQGYDVYLVDESIFSAQDHLK